VQQIVQAKNQILYVYVGTVQLHLRIFIAAFCVGCLFGKLISNNKLRISKVYLQFIALLQPAVLSASLHLKPSCKTDGANVCNDFSDGLGIFQSILLYVLNMHLYLYSSWRCCLYRKFCPTNLGVLLLVCYCFNFSKKKNTCMSEMTNIKVPKKEP
jgi:hypothetical protein